MKPHPALFAKIAFPHLRFKFKRIFLKELFSAVHAVD
jgi:hypothetical protein